MNLEQLFEKKTDAEFLSDEISKYFLTYEPSGRVSQAIHLVLQTLALDAKNAEKEAKKILIDMRK